MRAGELECLHGVGHSAGVHGCDGCCTPLVRKAKAEAWEEGFTHGSNSPVTGQTTDNPYRHGEEHAHTKRSSFGDPYCKTCGIDLDGETE